MLEKMWTTVLDVLFEDLDGMLKPDPLSSASGPSNNSLFGIDIGQLQRHNLIGSKSALVHHVQNRGVSKGTGTSRTERGLH